MIQVRAMLRANAATGNLNILLPMVTSLDEVDEARRLIERAGREVEEMIGYEIPKPRIGIMLEVPSMVFMLPHLAKRVDFISVGTNDLTQYILAVDRNNTRVANIYDSLHPAMLRALAMIAREAEIHGIDLRLCGEMAGDPMCVAILIGLGYRHLSMNGRSVARAKSCCGALIMPKQKILRSVVWKRNWRPKFAIRLQPLWSVAAWAG